MKELSIEEKAKRYDNLLVKLQEAKVDNSVCDERYCCVIDDIVPELKEDEGVWLTKFIQEEIDCLRYDVRDNEDRTKLENLRKSLSWLEKQGEQKHWDSVKPISEEDKLYLIPYEQKHAWSEEDERIISKILSICDDFKRSFRISPSSSNTVQKDIDKINNWLKSLRPQNTWKPSDGQMDALSAINVTGDISYAGQGQELINLYNDLKKLSEG